MGVPSKQAFQNPKLIQLGEAIVANYDQSLFEARMDVEDRRAAAERAAAEAAEARIAEDAAIVSASMMTSEQIRKVLFVEKMKAAKARKAAERAAAAAQPA